MYQRLQKCRLRYFSFFFCKVGMIFSWITFHVRNGYTTHRKTLELFSYWNSKHFRYWIFYISKRCGIEKLDIFYDFHEFAPWLLNAENCWHSYRRILGGFVSYFVKYYYWLHALSGLSSSQWYIPNESRFYINTFPTFDRCFNGMKWAEYFFDVEL